MTMFQRRSVSLTHRPLGVITNGDEDQQKEKLSAVGIAGAFEVVVCSRAVGMAKLDPRLFAHAAHLFNAGRLARP